MVVTMLEARVAPEKEADLIRAYEELGELPPFIVEAFLLHATDSDVWRMVNVVRSREELEGMRASMLASGEAPGGVRVFRVVGAEPTLTIFDVVAHPPIRPATTS